MRGSHLMTLGLFALIGGCAHRPETAQAPGLAWSLHATRDEGVKLAYGQPNSDNVVVMMACQPQSKQVRLSAHAPVGAAPEVTLASRGERQTLTGQLGPSGFGDSQLVEVDVPSGSKPLAGFASGGELSIQTADQATRVMADRKARAAVATFFATCRAEA